MERPSSLVLCCDLDAFFYQVELLRDPTIGGKPVAIQQHSEIICANYEAKAAGVRKRMSSADCRALLGPLGGINVHVHTEPGGRVSYLPYQKASADFFRLLRALPWAGAVVEKGSIDEAYIGISVGAQEAAPTAAAGRALAQQLRDRVQQELGLAASVGVAPNRLLAKLASRLAKPPASGVHVLWTAEEVDAALGACPPSRLPGLGGKAGGGLAALGAASALDMCRFSAAELERALGLPPEKAAKIWGFCRGLDDTPVVDRGPPQSLSVQMSLSPVELPMHPSASRGVPVGGGPPGRLTPLVIGAADFAGRCRLLVAAMGPDLLSRVQQDHAEEARWPSKLGVQVRAMGAGRDLAVTGRSAPFPPRALAGDALQAALVRALEGLCAGATATYPAGCKLVELRLVAERFAPVDAAAAPITRFFRPAAAASSPARAAEQPAERGGVAGSAAAAPAAAAPRDGGGGRGGGGAAGPSGVEVDLDLGGVDLAEQRRLLAEIERGKGALGPAPAKAGGKRRGGPGAKPDAKQPKIAGFFAAGGGKKAG